VTDDVIAAIDELAVLAPLHNPANAAGIRAVRSELPDAPQVAVFDTAFHATIPSEAFTYAVPATWRTEYGVRRYGFHGTSHAWVSRQVAHVLNRPLEELATVVLHLGNGASACAVRAGRSVDTSMGMTPLAGLVMGTRSGDVDPAVPGHVARIAGMSPDEIDDALTTRSGLLALAGVADMRDVLARAEAGDPDAALALDVYAYRVRSQIGAYAAVLGGVDAVAFTGGVGENAASVRERCLEGLAHLGITLDPDRNGAAARGPRLISRDGAPVAVLVVPTDEEREIALQALAVARG
jgi:acetate kinase